MKNWNRDAGICPGVIGRAFGGSEFSEYTKRTSQQHAKAGMHEREAKKASLQADVVRLEQTQAKRPLKPPTRYRGSW